MSEQDRFTIQYDNLRSFCFSNDKQIKGPVKGIIVSFMGLNGNNMPDEECDNSRELAEKGLIYMRPYLNPWNWMNPAAIEEADRILDILCERYGKDLPVCSSGPSMGGQGALVFAARSRHHIASCVLCCPVCDLVYHYFERPDVARTVYSSYSYALDQPGGIEKELEKHSPVHLAAEMPDVPYAFFHTVKDQAVSKVHHSDKMVAALRDRGFRVIYHEVQEGGHCDFPAPYADVYNQTIMDMFEL